MLFFLKKWNELKDVKSELALRDWFYGTKISLSLCTSKEPLTFLVNVEGRDKGLFSEEDFIVVNCMCEPVFENEEKPAAESFMHADIYKKSSAECILQVQTVDSHLISELYGEEGEVTFDKRSVERVFGKEGITEMTIPIVEDEKKFADLLENDVPNFIEGGGVVLVHNYGMIVWGKTPEEAKKWLEGIEYLMNYHVKLLMIKGAKSSVI
ncbi:class II aldolase/adducin family protein [Bacillus cereus]|uniref:Methylthioribulose-1-phosphate dehydratase n=2 Tax=Bacillus cereus group TaxID=86661 RepID=A0A2B0X6D9_BACAN|nr:MULTISPECIES: class II aldolase/adducin family protein [Bacillus]KZD28626.1 Methylthioribulose-1-phosphate dehydratase related protein [Bacillus cereus]MBJ8058258.1 class II aldolase/adducin family protein [Bacillus cereus]MCU4757746.1 class II aldolase/adducin family protein [Bacillus cereus]MCU4991657.1 class II aldolase/adducin family protein [Bacillus cereus]MCU5105175.1 class II aldolase/adducin family protein [Bacillus cereus]